jgi:hypothetical protein
MKIEYVKNPKWSNASKTSIDLTIKWEGIKEEFPFTSSPSDSEVYGKELYEKASNGLFGEVAEYIPPPPAAPPTADQLSASRRIAYQAEADPLYFKWQRGEATQQEWLDKVAEIKQRIV